VHLCSAARIRREVGSPGYSSVEILSKEANLMRAASRYKVDAAKITAGVTAELSAKKKAGKAESREQQRRGKKVK